VVAGEYDTSGPWASAFGRFVAVTVETEPVENWLDVPREIENVWDAGNWSNLAKRAFQGVK
jgi:hypothetical protein